MFKSYDIYAVLNDTKTYYEIIDTEWRHTAPIRSIHNSLLFNMVEDIIKVYSATDLNIASNLALAIRCVLCGETIRSYILAKKDGRYQYPNPQFEKIEHKEIKDCLVFLQTRIKDLESEVRHLDSKID